MEVVTDPHRFGPSTIPLMIGSHDPAYRETGWTPSIPLDKTLADILAYWESRLKN